MLSKTNSVQFSKPVKTVIRLKLFDNLSHILHKWIQRKKKKKAFPGNVYVSNIKPNVIHKQSSYETLNWVNSRKRSCYKLWKNIYLQSDHEHDMIMKI